MHGEGPMLVLAGAGSGKTRVVTRRIARLIATGVSPALMMAVTFTNKAAAEMRERIAQLVGPRAAKEMRVMTFHSFGLELLGAEAHALGLQRGGFTIYDQADCTSTLREILRTIDAGKRFDIAGILARISLAKNAFETAETWVARPYDEYDEIACAVFPKYQAALRAFHAFDFDDLVTEAVLLLRRREDIRQRWQRKIRYLMVDEYQDTNAAQLELVRLLSGQWNNVVVVGDDDQSIYAWRGADITNILNFTEHFPNAKVVKLEENYRSSGAILAVANAVLSGSRGKRFGKVLKATHDAGQKVEIAVCLDPEIEAHFIVEQIRKATIADSTLTHDEIAVLYRSNSQAEPIELALKESGIPHRIIGGQKFYERKEVKDLLAYLRVALAPEDEISVRRVLNYPARGIGDASLSKLSSYAVARDLTLWQAIERAEDINVLSSAVVEACRQFEQVITVARQSLERGVPSHQVAEDLCRRIQLKEDLMEASTGETFARRWRNVESLLQLLRRRDERGPSDLQAVNDYLRMLTLQLSEEDEDARRVVTLCTMHGAKGLEWRLVFVIGVEEGFLPHTRTTDPRISSASDQDIEEERRLFYVAVTRAREKLWMTRCKHRSFRGRPVSRTSSRFLLDIPQELYDQREVSIRPGPDYQVMARGAASVLKALEDIKNGTARPATRFRR